MIDREQFEALKDILVTFYSEKENRDQFALPLSMQYDMDRRTKDFDPAVTKVGLIVVTESDDAVLDGVLSKNGNVMAIYIPYSEVPSKVLNNPGVINFEVCGEKIIKILQSSASQNVELKTPWSGPVGDEWDSPAYNDFWGPVEQNFNRIVKTLEKVGKKVKVISG
ncbi:MAG: hypothetical protein HYV90_04010 [Candidatus Woesebacteria bacterium]|nr:MAG: hypothetical protein HYV90_04010 [Candidatus Woesebacteria bacterium]